MMNFAILNINIRYDNNDSDIINNNNDNNNNKKKNSLVSNQKIMWYFGFLFVERDAE